MLEDPVGDFQNHSAEPMFRHQLLLKMLVGTLICLIRAHISMTNVDNTHPWEWIRSEILIMWNAAGQFHTLSVQIERRVLLIANCFWHSPPSSLSLKKAQFVCFFVYNYHVHQFLLPSALEDSKCLINFFKEKFISS